MSIRPTRDQVLALAPDKAAATAALPLAVPVVWSAAGCDDAAVWGQYVATSAEPYDVAVDLSDDAGGPAYRCNCPSRKVPCKHSIGLLLLHADGQVGVARRLPFAAQWLQRRKSAPNLLTSADSAATTQVVPTHDGGEAALATGGALGGGARSPRPAMSAPDPAVSKRQFERSERMRAGLKELDRWIADRIRVGLAAAELTELATWDRLAARLVDAQCGGLANRVKRVASKVGQHPRWHEDLLEELALLHALAAGALRSSTLPSGLAEGVHAATGLTVAKDDVLAGVPSTARWIVAGESRTREDRITVQRTWLSKAPADGPADGPATSPATGPATWAMVLAFGAFGKEVTTEHHVGTSFVADVHWYPGGIALRALVGRMHGAALVAGVVPPASTVADALATCGWSIAGEPWLERSPMCIQASPASLGNGRWALADESGAVPVVAHCTRMAEIVAVSGGAAVTVMGEWSTEGFLPLTVFAGGQVVVL